MFDSTNECRDKVTANVVLSERIDLIPNAFRAKGCPIGGRLTSSGPFVCISTDGPNNGVIGDSKAGEHNQNSGKSKRATGRHCCRDS